MPLHLMAGNKFEYTKIVYFLKKLVGMWGCNNVDNMQYESTQNDCCLTNRFL